MHKVVVGKLFCQVMDLDGLKQIKRKAHKIGIGANLAKEGRVYDMAHQQGLCKFHVREPLGSGGGNGISFTAGPRMTWASYVPDQYVDIKIQKAHEIRVGDKLPGFGRIEDIRCAWTGNEIALKFVDGGSAVLSDKPDGYYVERQVKSFAQGDFIPGRGTVLQVGWEAHGLGYGYAVRSKPDAQPIFYQVEETCRVRLRTREPKPGDIILDLSGRKRTIKEVRYVKTALELGWTGLHVPEIRVAGGKTVDACDRNPCGEIDLWPHQKAMLAYGDFVGHFPYTAEALGKMKDSVMGAYIFNCGANGVEQFAPDAEITVLRPGKGMQAGEQYYSQMFKEWMKWPYFCPNFEGHVKSKIKARDCKVGYSIKIGDQWKEVLEINREVPIIHVSDCHLPPPPAEWLVTLASGTKLRLFPGTDVGARVRANRVQVGDEIGSYAAPGWSSPVKAVHDVEGDANLVVIKTETVNHLFRRNQEVIIKNMHPSRLNEGDEVRTPGNNYALILKIETPVTRTFGPADVEIKDGDGKVQKFRATKVELTGIATGGSV